MYNYSMSDITPPDYSTAIGQVRLLIPDVEQLENLSDPSQAAEYIFNDSQIQAFLSINRNNVKRSAAQAKLTLATSEALINKVIKSYDFSTDGAKLGAELRAQAEQLQKDADRDDLYDLYEMFTIVNPCLRSEDDWL
jgi:hypothetical protein